jgi:bla regulator protein BlaR1
MLPEYLTSALPNHLWQSTLFAIVAGLLTLLLRKNHAQARYGLWLIASLKFLIPFSLLVRAGKSFAWSAAAPSTPSAGFSLAMEAVSRPFVAPAAPSLIQPAATLSATSAVPVVLFAIWVCGFVTAVLFWWIRWRRVRAVVRSASPLPINPFYADVPLLGSPTLLEPGVFGILAPKLILPAGITEHLAPAQLNAILAHELCHVRRRDNLAAAIHMLVEAVFWFHPLIWWIGARLVEERERACDEEVLRLGSEPQVYAESILKTCQFYLESPLICVSGVTGSDLKKRIVRIMTQRVTSNLGPGRKLLLAAAGVAAVAGPIVFGLMNAPQSRAESPAAVSPAPAFEVASVKPNKSSDRGGRIMFGPGGRFVATNISVKGLIHIAYGVQDFQISGGPPWLGSDRYDIEAKAEGPSEGDIRNMSEEQRKLEMDRRRLMLQALLAERFKLTLHKESKEAPIYALVVAKNGPKLKEATREELAPPPAPADPSDKPDPKREFKVKGQGIGMRPGEVSGQAVKLSFLADVLSNQPELGRTVLDKTGLKGSYDFTLKWTAEGPQGPMFKGPGDAPPPPDPNGPSLFTALEEQLGLKLESQKGPVDLLVIDRVEKASEN